MIWWAVATVLLCLTSFTMGWWMSQRQSEGLRNQAQWCLSHSKEVMEQALSSRLSALEREQETLQEGGVIAKRLEGLTTASAKLEQVVAHLYLESQGSGRRLRDPMGETQRGEEQMLPFPPGAQRAKLPETEPVKDGFEKEPITRPGILKNRHEPARGEPS